MSVFPNMGVGLSSIKDAELIQPEGSEMNFVTNAKNIYSGDIKFRRTRNRHDNPFINGTRQNLSVFFDPNNGGYQINLKDEELLELVQNLSFRDKEDQIIRSANKRDTRDPFFSQISLSLNQGKAQLETSLDKDWLLLKMIEKHPDFAEYGTETKEGDYPPKFWYKWGMDSQIGRDIERESNDLDILRALLSYQDDAETLKSLCRILNLQYRIDGEDLPNEKMVSLISVRSVRDDSDPKKRRSLQRYLNLGKEGINVVDKVKMGYKKRYITFSGNSAIFMNEVLPNISGDLNAVFSYFKNPKNKDDWNKLLEVLGDKKSPEEGF